MRGERPTVVIADCDFPANDTERRVLEAAGCELRIESCKVEDDIIDHCADAEGLIVQYAPMTRRVLTALPKLKVVSRYGVGADTIDHSAAAELGIWIGNVPNFCTVEVAEHALALLLALNRRLFLLDAHVKAGRWSTIDVMGDTRPLSERTLGLIGFGEIARALAVRAGAIGLTVLCYSPNTTPERAAEYDARRVELDELFRQSDFLSLHCPLNEKTRKIVNIESLGLMKPGAFLINTSRGALVDEAALAQALESGRIGGAALDVLEVEPVRPDNPLLGFRNVILTPHSGYFSLRALEDLQTRVARNVVEVLRGREPLSPVNRPARPRSLARKGQQ